MGIILQQFPVNINYFVAGIKAVLPISIKLYIV